MRCISAVLCSVLILFSSPVFAQSEKELFLVAQKAFEDGFYDVATRYINQYLDEYPDGYKTVEAKLLLGQCKYFQKQYLKAFSLFDELQSQSEYSDAILFWIGETYFKVQDYQKAQDYYKQVIKVFPNSLYTPQAYYSLGWTYFEQERFEEAHFQFAYLADNFPEHHLKSEGLFTMGQALTQLAQYDQAIDTFKRFIKEEAKSPKVSEAHFQIAEIYYQMRKYDLAIDAYAQTEEKGLNSKFILLAQIGQGWAHLKTHNYEQSLSAFQRAESQALQRNVSVLDALLGQAAVYNEQNRYDEALNIYDRLLKSGDSKNLTPDVYLGRANVFYHLEQYEQAVEGYKELITTFSRSSGNESVLEKAYFGLAWTHLKMGTMDEAINVFEQILDTADNRHAKISALTQIGDAYQEVGELDRAIEIYDRILKEYPDNPYLDYIQFQQGVALLKQGKLDIAQVSLQSLKNNFPNSRYLLDAQYYLGVAYFQQEDWAATKEVLEELIKGIDHSHTFAAESYYLLGLAYYNLGKHDQAQATFKVISKSFKSNIAVLGNAELNIARSLLKSGDTKDGLKKLQWIVKKFQNKSVAADALQEMGEYYFQQESYEKSLGYFNQIKDIYKSYSQIYLAYYYSGKINQELGEFDKALSDFQVSRNAEDEDLVTKSEIAIADIFSNDNNFDEALEKYKEIASNNADFRRDAYARIAKLYAEGKDHLKQIEYYQKALDTSRVSSDMDDAQVQFYLADAYEVGNQIDKAIEEYLKIPYLYSNDMKWVIKSYLRVARLFEHQEMWQEAASIYQKIIDLDAQESKYAQERISWITGNFNF